MSQIGIFDKIDLKEVYLSIQEIYQTDPKPWVVGYSGGKDSTAVVQLIFEALLRLPRKQLHKPIYVISSDTLVETPLIISYIDKNLHLIEDHAKKLGLPISTHKVMPKLDNSFWVTLIGKGYPSPRQKFRWCTDRLKIEPANRFIKEQISKHGEVIVVLGVRRSESSSRAQVLDAHKIGDRVLRRHSSLPNAYVFAPIEDFSTDDVWKYLLQRPSPWEGDNHQLLSLYQDSSGECPLVIDKETPSCGNSRFGCWVCTVVKEDKALIGFIENGEEWLTPLLEYRNWICEIRDNPDYREKKRQDGSIYYVGSGDNRRIGYGPFSLKARYEMLQKLLEIQKQMGRTLVLAEEIQLIDSLWSERGDWFHTAAKIYENVFKEKPPWAEKDTLLFAQQEIEMLEQFCEGNNIPMELVYKLLILEQKHAGFKHRHRIFKEIHKIMSQDWLHLNKGGQDL